MKDSVNIADEAFSTLFLEHFLLASPGWAPARGWHRVGLKNLGSVSEMALAFLSNLFLRSYLEILLMSFPCEHFHLGKQLLGSAVPLLAQMSLFNVLNFSKISCEIIILLAFVKYFYCFQNTSTLIRSYVFFHTSSSPLNPIQSGFLPHRSTKAALIRLAMASMFSDPTVTSLAFSY